MTNIYQYYVAYLLVLQQLDEKNRATQTIKGR
jgi:hypothetical protein